MKIFNYYNHGKNFKICDEMGQNELFSLQGKSLKIGSFSVYWERYFFWFVIFKYNIIGKHFSNFLFSEKYKHTPIYRIFNWGFTIQKVK